MTDQHYPSESIEVPALSTVWPPDAFQLAHLVDQTHWALEQLAYDIPRRAATRGQLDEVARALEGLALLLRQHEVDEGRREDDNTDE